MSLFGRRVRVIGGSIVLLAGLVLTDYGAVSTARPSTYSLADAVAAAGSRTLVYQFGADHRVPMRSADGTTYDMSTDSRVLVVPHASTSGLVSSLLVDRTFGDALRCETTPAATAGGLRQTSEVYGPVEAWQRLGSPDVTINANFFDVRPQTAGSTWGLSGCSTPMGTYYDTHLATRSVNFLRFYDRFLVGASGLSDGAGERWSPLSTFFIDDGALFRPPGPARFEMSDAVGASDNGPAQARLSELEMSGRQYTAIAGIKLFGAGDDVQFVDDPKRRAARTAIGYNTARDELYLFQGGSDEEDGFTIGNVQDFFRSVGTDLAIALDGGGSSAMVVDKDADILWAGDRIEDGRAPAGSCSEVPSAYCSPGAARPVPGWLGIR